MRGKSLSYANQNQHVVLAGLFLLIVLGCDETPVKPPMPHQPVGKLDIVWHSPTPQGNSLLSVWGSSAQDIFAVGESGTVVHFDGVSWDIHSVATTADLRSVWSSGPSDVYAAGDDGTILHYDGMGWSPMRTWTNEDFHSISGHAPKTVIAVGTNGTALRLKGTQWDAMKSGTDEWLRSVWVETDSLALSGGRRGTLRQYDGSVWTTIDFPQRELITDVSIDPKGQRWATTWDGRIWFLDGARWRNYSVSGPVFSQWHVGADQWYATQSDYVFQGDSFGLIPTNQDLALYDIWGVDAGRMIAVGKYGTILDFDGATFTPASAGSRANVNGIHGRSESDIVAVGSGGIVRRYNGQTWSETTIGNDLTLNGVWLAPDGSAIAVGSRNLVPGIDDAVAHYDGASWTVSSTDLTETYYDVWGISSSSAWAAGWNGTVARFDGTTWSLEHRAPAAELRAIAGRSGSDIYAVGCSGVSRTGLVLHYDGVSWSTVADGQGAELHGVWPDPAGPVWAVGENGTILRCNGGGCELVDSATRKFITDITGGNDGSVLAVCWDGEILTFDSGHWQRWKTGTANDFRSAWWSRQATYIVGDHGTIVSLPATTP